MGNQSKKFKGSKADRGHQRKCKHARHSLASKQSRASSHGENENSFGSPSPQKIVQNIGTDTDVRADVWRTVKNIQTPSLMKCAKCGTTRETNPELSFHKFPLPLRRNNKSVIRCRAWAEYCWPDKVLTPEELTNVYKEKQVLCSKHFPDKETAKRLGLQLGVPADFPTEDKKNHIRTYGKKVDDKTDSNTASNNIPKHNFLEAEKNVNKSKNNLSPEEEKHLEHNFLEGENAAELFETIDEVFEDPTDVSMYVETDVKIEPCDSLLHEGYKCDVCLSPISGYRYTCVQCADVDLCGACEASGAHAAHYVLRVPRPRPEEEVEELLKELRHILKKRPPPAPPAEKIMITNKRVPAAQDPLLARAPPGVPCADQSESDNEATESGSEDENVPERPDIADSVPERPDIADSVPERPDIVDSPPARISQVDLNIKDTQTSRQEEILLKRFKPCLDYEAKPINTKIADRLIIKRSNSNKSNKTPDKDVVSRGKVKKTAILVNTLKDKLKSAIEIALTSEIFQQAKTQIEDEMEIDKDLGENDGSDINKIRSRRGELDSEHLQETVDEEPLDFIMQMEHFNEDDPLAFGVPAKAKPKTKNVQIVTVEDVLSYTKRKSQRISK